MPRIAFASLGCKLNRYEIQVMAETLAPFGFESVPFAKEADCYVVNTCGVTRDADYSSRQLIRRARKRNPGAKIVVTGCYAQLKPSELEKLEIDAIISNHEKVGLPSIVLGLFGNVIDNGNFGDDHGISGMGDMTRAFVKIEDGCDDQCTYCAIWIARGPVNSRPMKNILEEINKLYSNGYREIVLTGIHIGKYSEGDLDFRGLLREIVKGTDMPRIRLSSLNPLEITSGLVEIMAMESKICPHVHLSIQSSDDVILRLMGRRYGRNDTREAIRLLTQSVSKITIGADFIVGFPGETFDKFENTRRFIEESNLHHLHVFPYSDRPGTVAAGLPGKIDPAEKSKRTATLRKLGREKKKEHLERFIGDRLNILFEKRAGNKPGILTGLSENYIRIAANGDHDLKGKIMEVRPHGIRDEMLISRVISEPSQSKSS